MKKFFIYVTLILGVLTAYGVFFPRHSEAQLSKVRNVVGNRIVAYDSLGVRGPLKVEGAATFTNRVVGSSANFCVAGSFTTTALLDTTVMTGAAAGDIILVTPANAAGEQPDTNMFYYAYVLNTDSVLVGRTAQAAGGDAKSGGAYFLVKIEK